MSFDLEQLRLDIPPETFSTTGGVSPFWRPAALGLFAVSIGLAAWMIAGPRAASDQVTVPVHVIAPQQATEFTAFTAGGWVEPAWPFPTVVSANVDGRIESLQVANGQVVSKGDLIAVVHNLPWRQVVTAAEAHLAAEEAEVEAQQAALARLRAGYRAEEIAVAKAELDEAKASLTLLEAGYRKEEIAQAQAELNAALALAAHLEREAARSEALITKNFVSRSEADRNRAAADAAGARVLALEAVLSRLKAGPRTEEIRQAQSRVQVTEARLALMQAGTRAEEITEAEARLEAARARVEAAETALEAAQRDVGYCMVRAPHDGVILEITAPAGTWLHAEKRAIVHMYDAAQMQARVDVRQENAATLEIGQQCTVKLESRKDAPYTGRVVRIDPQGNLARDTVRVRVQIENPDALLRIDLTVTVDFLAAEAATQAAPLVVPTSAVFKRDGGFHVFAVRGGEARLRPVELGKQTATGYVVLSGIDAGEVVATGNLAMLADGTPVTLSEDAP